MRDHLSTYLEIVAKLETMEVEINGELLSVMLLQTLPASFDKFRCAIKSRDKLPDAESLIVKIFNESESKKQHSAGSEFGAMFAKKSYQKRAPRNYSDP